MATKVSVVVPVYNPGRYIEPCLRSLAAQTLPATEVELIFVDDGSTDDSPERLRRFAEQYPQTRVLRIPNSGWPGMPRNVGTDAARGEYVMFVDQDDQLEPEALERMYGLGAANGADVVLGKVISDFRGVHHALYRENRPRCDVFDGGLMNSLTPHKMLRTAFLRDQGIRFPEGPRRLEDQLFMTRAYFAAKAASIVSDYVCYRYLRRPDGGNAGSRRIDPPGYYANLAEVLDVVDAGTTPGEQRWPFYRRFLRTEMLGRLSSIDPVRTPPGYLQSLHREIRTLLEQRFPAEVEEGLGAALRGKTALLRCGTLHELAEQAAAVASVLPTVRLLDLRRAEGTRVEVTVEARLRLGDLPLHLERGRDGWLLPRAVTGPAATDEERRLEPVEEMVGDLVVRHREQQDEWFVPGGLRAHLEESGDVAEVVWTGVAVVDPLTAAGGLPLRRGLQDFFVRVQAFGLTRTKRLGKDRADGLAPLPLLVDAEQHVHQFYDTDLGNLSLNVQAAAHWLESAARSARFVDGGPDALALELGAVWAAVPELVLTLTSSETGVVLAVPLAPRGPDQTRWAAAPSARLLLLAPGRYRAALTLPGLPDPVELDSGFVLDSRRRRRWLRSLVGPGRSRTS